MGHFPCSARSAGVAFEIRGTNRVRVLVTGAAGYIGSVTATTLLARGHEVVAVDDLSAGRVDAVPIGVPLVVADVGNEHAMRRVVEHGGFDACVHFAASIEAGESMRRPEAFFANNTAATLRLLRSLVEGGVDRVVFSSTAAVYGDPVRVPIEEDDPTEPTNVYGESKLLVERALGWMARTRGLRYAALRYFNAAGGTPKRGETHDPETHLIPLVLAAAAGRRPDVTVFGTDYATTDGTAVRDYVHVLDLADAHARALEALDTAPALVCNLGNGAGFTVRQVIDVAREVTGRDIAVREGPRRPGDPAQLVASSDRARDVLGWRPAHADLHDIVGSAWEWHRTWWARTGTAPAAGDGRAGDPA